MRQKPNHTPEFFLKHYKNENSRKVAICLWRRWLRPHSIADSPENVTQHMLDADLKPATIKKVLYIYKKWLEEYTLEKVAPDIRPMIRHLSRIEDPPTPKAWSKEEATKALDLAHLDTCLYNMLLVTLHTGMRKGELFGLTWGDIDFVTGFINIRHSKSGRPRSIPMSASVQEVLQSRYTVGMQDDESCFDMCEPNGKLKKLCEMAGVRPITWHGLRHTFATLALDAGRSPREVAEILGHTKVSTTLDIYWQKTGRAIDFDFLP